MSTDVRVRRPAGGRTGWSVVHDRLVILNRDDENRASRPVRRRCAHRGRDTGLGLTRTDGVVVIQITQQGRGRDDKEALYATLAQRLDGAGLVAPSDLIVSLIENTQEDWSFGMGRAQFLTGEL